jgi:acetoin utilization protein AcuB
MVTISVRDWMTTDPVTVPLGTSLATARALMQRDEVGRLLVVDGDGLVVGVVSRLDVMAAWPSEFQPLEPVEVRELMARVLVDEVMARAVVTVDSEATVAEAVNVMFEHRIGAVPVIEAGRVVGILTCSDVFQGLVRVLAHRE